VGRSRTIEKELRYACVHSYPSICHLAIYIYNNEVRLRIGYHI